jgi:hypothetical protein
MINFRPKRSISYFLSVCLLFSKMVLISNVAISADYSGKYNADFNFKMGSMTVCPKVLPIDIQIEVDLNGNVEGYIFNNGGGNDHKFCKLYHNGTISGSLDGEGNLKGVKINQKDSHAKKYSSFRITGNINETLTLHSKNSQYHPRHKFKLAKEKVAIKPAEPDASSAQMTNVQSKQSLGKVPSNDRVVTAAPKPVASSSSAVTISSNNQSVSVSTSNTYTKWRGAESVEQAQQFANEIQASIVMFMAISEVIEKQPLSMKERILSVVGSEITRLQAEKSQLQELLTSRFSTPIRPQNANLSVSAFRAADTFPKIPFYVPGTAEIGEMLAIPRVTDDGYLVYQFDFLDPTSTYDKVRDTIEVRHSEIQSLIDGLHKVDEWTKVAQENNVNRRIEKTSSCIPEGACTEKKQGVSSTEVVFQIYEDGSTAGRIQRNKGKFAVGYNMSVESSILLSAYLTYMKEAGSKEFNIGVMTDKEVEKLFK